MREPKDRAYVENYEPLVKWLETRHARCDLQVPVGKAADPDAYIERWQVPGDPERQRSGGEIFVVVYADKRGWNIYTCDRSNSIDWTLADVEHRLGLSVDPR